MVKLDGLVASLADSESPMGEQEELAKNYEPPLTVNSGPRVVREISLEEAILTALTHSRVLRDLGGRLVQLPSSVKTIMDPAIAETDPQFGIETALSAFDTTWSTSLFFENNDRAVNNVFESQAADGNIFQQDSGSLQTELSKTSASGTRFTLSQDILYDSNNSDANTFPSSWFTQIQAEVRQPLLQGRGVSFNRVAGPNGNTNSIRGVVISRMKTDISQLEFEIGVRDLINNVENAYWDLYFAYRLLESRVAARDAALKIYKKIKARENFADVGQLQQVSEQYWRFQEDVIAAETGKTVDGTRSNNGSTGGTFTGNLGVHVAERRLRLLIGIEINDNDVLRPQEDPVIAEVDFEWKEIVREALNSRPEIRRQELMVKQKGIIVAANRNFLLPRVDLVGGYRWRGFGDSLIAADRNGQGRVDNAFMDLTSGDFQEWFVGTEAAVPIGFRQAATSLRNAQLQQSRQAAIMRETKKQIVHDLSNAYAELKKAHKLMEISFNRRAEAKKRVELLRLKDDIGLIDAELDSERRAADSDSHFFQALVTYLIAIKNVHLEKGSLLRYNKVYLSDLSNTGNRAGSPSRNAAEVRESDQERATQTGLPDGPAVAVSGANSNNDGLPTPALEPPSSISGSSPGGLGKAVRVGGFANQALQSEQVVPALFKDIVEGRPKK
ncbi:MAG: TolC family protein [Pirellulaceae bacterium]|nr:TolC family protein [Pirellulaceae bacterium]